MIANKSITEEKPAVSSKMEKTWLVAACSGDDSLQVFRYLARLQNYYLNQVLKSSLKKQMNC